MKKVLLAVAALAVLTIVHGDEESGYKEVFTDLLNRAASRSLKFIQQASRQQSLEVLPGVTLTSDGSGNSQQSSRAFEDDELPSDPSLRTKKLMYLVLDSTSNFISGRSLTVKMPKVDSVAVTKFIEEGRAKMKKMNPLLLSILGKAALGIPIVTIILFFLATKALITAKIAFVIAAVLAAKSYFNEGFNLKNIGGQFLPYGGYGAGAYNPGLTSNTLGGYPYARSIDEIKDESDTKTAQDLAYSQSRPQ